MQSERSFLRELRACYGAEYDSGKRPEFGYRGSGHWENEWRWVQSAVGIVEAYRRFVGRIPSSILEIGCGTGAMTVELSRWCHEVVGLDWGNNIKHPGCVVADAGALPFVGCFELVVALDVIEHVPADLQDRLFRELRRVTKDYLIVTVPTEEPHYTLDSSAGFRNHYICESPQVWAAHFRERGFEIVAQYDDLVTLGAPFAWGDTNYPFFLRRRHESSTH